jgi:hypothetical protein
MTLDFVLVKADVSVTWSGDPPNIRVYVGDELFTERTWVWQDEYLEELLQIQAPTGTYDFRWVAVAPAQAEIEVKNIRIDTGPVGAYITDDLKLRIT